MSLYDIGKADGYRLAMDTNIETARLVLYNARVLTDYWRGYHNGISLRQVHERG